MVETTVYLQNRHALCALFHNFELKTWFPTHNFEIIFLKIYYCWEISGNFRKFLEDPISDVSGNFRKFPEMFLRHQIFGNFPSLLMGQSFDFIAATARDERLAAHQTSRPPHNTFHHRAHARSVDFLTTIIIGH